MSTLGLKIGVAERLWLQLGVDTLLAIELVSFDTKKEKEELAMWTPVPLLPEPKSRLHIPGTIENQLLLPVKSHPSHSQLSHCSGSSKLSTPLLASAAGWWVGKREGEQQQRGTMAAPRVNLDGEVIN
jgi:hypothetical protein